MVMADLAVIGSPNDASLNRLLEVAQSLGLSTEAINYTDSKSSLTLNPHTHELDINGRALFAKSVFYRMQYFEKEKEASKAFQDRSHVGYAMIDSWAIMNPDVRSFNKGKTTLGALNKPLGLMMAQAFGLKIPNTIISNVLSDIEEKIDVKNAIAKPVVGGDFVRTFDQTDANTEWINNLAPHAATVQNKLDYPEYRVYIIGNSTCSFEVKSKDLDYREFPNYEIKYIPDGPPDSGILNKLKTLADEFGLSFAAADLKTNTATGDIEFLEINSMPMFAVYDRVSEGELNKTILKELGILV